MKLENLATVISSIHRQSQSRAGMAVNQILNYRNWLIGAYIIEFEQGGEDRAEYGERILKELARRLEEQDVAGFSTTNLKGIRKVALTWSLLEKGQTVSDLLSGQKGQTLSGVLRRPALAISDHSESGEWPELLFFPRIQDQEKHLDWQNGEWTAKLFRSLSFSHLLELARVDDPLKRAFYELECMRSGWSVRELKRQRNSMLYERVGLSKDKDAVMALAHEGRLVDSPETILRDPYILEFTGLEKRAAYNESELEKALLNELESFLLELGRDFCFVERQMRITVAGRHHYLDLLFFHRELRCLVAIDLKIGTFEHENAGQMNFYLNYLKDNVAKEGESPPVGILLCADKDSEEVHYATTGLDNSVFVSRYLVALPSEEQLKEFLRREQELIARAHPDEENS